MNAHDESFTLHSSLGGPNHESTGSSIPSQVLFMDTHDMPSRADSYPPPSAYYQVATPKSPHELTLEGEEDVVHGDGQSNQSMHMGHDDDHMSPHDIVMEKSSRESEEMERLKYETAKNEILDKLHLHTLISHKELQGIQKEIMCTDAQMMLLRKLHDDKELTRKIEESHEVENEKKKRHAYDISDVRSNSSGYPADATSTDLVSGTSANGSLSASSTMPMHHYHTRSKSHGNVTEVPHLRPANSTIIDLRMTGAKAVPNSPLNNGNYEPGYEILPFRPNQMNLHHRRNYSSTSLTSNSGVVGKTEQNEAIFRRYDGILIVITCAHCKRSGFTSAQGIVNHARLKHGKTYSSQPLAVLNNQTILEDDKQDLQVLKKFKEMGKDPKTEYLPCEIAIPSTNRRSSQREISPKSTIFKNTESQSLNQNSRNVVHLEKMYNKNDFKDLVEMVNEAQGDLDVILKQSDSGSESNESEEDRNAVKEQSTESEYMAVSSSSEKKCTDVSSSSTKPDGDITLSIEDADKNDSAISSEVIQKKILKKRKSEADEHEKELKERLRPAEKKARPDVLALSNIPDHEKRSSHYNLRAKSKLRGINSKHH